MRTAEHHEQVQENAHTNVRTHDAFQQWLALLQPSLRRYALVLAGNLADAGDLMQATNLRALEKRRLFVEGSMLELRKWLMTVMVNLHRDGKRRQVREIRVEWIENIAAPEPQAPPRWAWLADDQLDAAVAGLGPHLREPYQLFAVEHCSYADISKRLHIPIATVATRIFRARSRLRATLGAASARSHA